MLVLFRLFPEVGRRRIFVQMQEYQPGELLHNTGRYGKSPAMHLPEGRMPYNA
jgi:hypothetical protein